MALPLASGGSATLSVTDDYQWRGGDRGSMAPKFSGAMVNIAHLRKENRRGRPFTAAWLPRHAGEFILNSFVAALRLLRSTFQGADSETGFPLRCRDPTGPPRPNR